VTPAKLQSAFRLLEEHGEPVLEAVAAFVMPQSQSVHLKQATIMKP
jgi:hypothetical protein